MPPPRSPALLLPLLALLPPGPAEEPEFDARRAWMHLVHQVGIGPRPSGSPANERLRDYLVAELERVGLEPVREGFRATTPDGPIEFENVYADLPATPAEGAPEPPWIVLATHFDTKHLPFHFLGANDGGSGTAVLLELARVLAEAGPRRASLRLLFLDGEEARGERFSGTDNCYGSRYHVGALRSRGELDRFGACVVLDMVGDRDLVLTEEGYSTPELLELFFEAARDAGLGRHVGARARRIQDDHQRFLEAGIPSVDLIDFEYGEDGEHWHARTDTLEQCSEESLSVAGRIVLAGLPRLEDFVLARAAKSD